MIEDFRKYSDEEAYRIARLIAAYIRGTISKREHDELDKWVEASDENMELFERLTDEENIDEAMKWMEAIQTEKALEKKKEKIFFNHRGRAIHFWQYAIAASIIITAGI